jgi:hypothetical protein
VDPGTPVADCYSARFSSCALFFVNTPASLWMRFNMGHANDAKLFRYFAQRLPALRRVQAPDLARRDSGALN